jgi:hypothetical protein
MPHSEFQKRSDSRDGQAAQDAFTGVIRRLGKDGQVMNACARREDFIALAR